MQNRPLKLLNSFLQTVDFFEVIINKYTDLTDMINKINRLKRRNGMNHQIFEGITAGLTNTLFCSGAGFQRENNPIKHCCSPE